MCAQPANNPFAIQLEVEFLDRVSEPVREGRAKSVSDLIRTALERFDFDNVVVVRPAQLTISVRLSREIRRKLKQLSKLKHASVGQLVRAAVEAYLPQLEHAAPPGGIEMPIPHIELPEEAIAAPVAAEAGAPAARAKKTPGKTTRPNRIARPVAAKKKGVGATPKKRATKSVKRPTAAPRRKGMTRKRTQG